MTTATLEKNSTDSVNEQSVKSIDKPDDTFPIIGRLFNYMADEDNRARFGLALVVRVIALICLTAIPFLTGEAINVVSDPNGNLAELQRWVTVGFIAGVIYLVMSFFAERIFADMATKGLQKLQNNLFAHMQTLSLTFFDRQPIGELMSRITNDTEVVSLFYEQAVSPIIRASIQILLTFLVMVIINWRLTIVALIIVPVILILTNVIERISTPSFAKMQEEMGSLSGFQEESLSGHKVIISKRQQDWADGRNDELAVGLYEVGSKAFFTSLLQYPLTQSLSSIQIVLVMVVGALMVVGGKTDLGTVIAFSGYTALLTRPLSEIANLTSTTLNAAAGGRRVFKIIDEQPIIKDAPDASEYEFKGGRIECVDVDFSYVPGRKRAWT